MDPLTDPGAATAAPAQRFDGAVPPPELVLLERAEAHVTRLLLADGRVLLRKRARGPHAAVRQRNERRILQRLDGVPGVPRLLEGVAEAGNGTADAPLLLHDDEGRPLLPSEGAAPLDRAALLALARPLVRVLADAHRRGVQHRNLHPGNIQLVGPQGAPLLVGWEHATTAAEEQPGFVHHSLVAGTLAYIAPEQTGRSGGGVDQRADLYALGATLYQLATGRPPFVDDDPLRLIHQHLAVAPVPVLQRRPELGAALSAVIGKLLEKAPDRRYQGAQGLLADLDELAQGVDEQGFEPGRNDFPEWLAPPSRLVGRDTEAALLDTALADALQGTRRAVLVAGAPGVGKSALIHTLRPRVTARRGWVVGGKFDQLRQDGDTDALRHALRALCRLLLAEPDEQLAAQRRRISDALGPLAPVLARSLPELATLLGVTAADAAADAAQAQTQQVQAVLALLRAVASPQRVLVMVIDDLQWAPAPALRLFDAIVTDPALRGLLLVGAYRSGEVDATHPLQACVDRWARRDDAPRLLALHNLPPADLGALLAAMLRLDAPRAAALAQVVAPRTAGNPFDTVELVNALRRDGVLQPGPGGWTWDERAIQRHVGQGDVIALLQQRMAALPVPAQGLLAVLACLGGEVPHALLQAALGLDAAATDETAAAALDDGLLVAVDDPEPALRFRHDRVQQAAYALLEGEAPQAHLVIARRLAVHEAFDSVSADQYLAAAALVDDADERRNAAMLMRNAARQLRGVSHARAQRLAATALQLLQPVADAADRPLQRELATEQHLALTHAGRLDDADAAFDTVLSLSDAALDPVPAACLQVSSLTQRARPRDAVDLGLLMLARLGQPVPADTAGTLDAGLVRLQQQVELQGTQPDPRPEVTDASTIAVAQLLDRLVIPSLQCDPVLNAHLAVRMHALWMQHGPCAALVRGVALSVPLVLLARRQAFRAAHTVALQAQAVGRARGYALATATAQHVFAISGQHWFGPLEDTVRLAHDAHEALLRGGDLAFAALTWHATAPALFDCAPTLADCGTEVDAGLGFAQRTGNEFAQTLYGTYRQLVLCLREPAPAGAVPGAFVHGGYDEAARQAGRGALGTPGAVFHLLRALAATFFGDTPRLVHHLQAAWPLLGALPGFHPTAWARALRVHALALQGDRAALPQADEALDWLRQRADDQGDNYRHLQQWAQAERALLAGDSTVALQAFDAALQGLQGGSRPGHLALITERAASCHLASGLVSSGRLLMAQARDRYAAWGAQAKVQQLNAQHTWLPPAHRTPERAVQSLDLMGVLRASQLLSSETSLPRLAQRVGEVLAAITGATGVTLLLRGEGPAGWRRLSADGQGAALQDPDPATLPMAALRHAERTLQPLLAADAVHDERLAGDPYLATLDRCALLVLPILHQGQPRALLLLENRIAAGSFAADQLDAVQLVAGQLAVSIENAQLYAGLEARVEQRTQQLRQAQEQLVDTARRAGMAEIATNVLHNVGNVLNSVNVSADLIGARVRASKAAGFGRAVQLIDDHRADLGRFFTQDEKGLRLPGYLARLAQAVATEQQELGAEVDELVRRVNHIKEIVATQQSYAGSGTVRQRVQVAALVHDAVQMTEASLTHHPVRLQAELPELPPLMLDRPRVLQILVNLIANARQACSESGRPDGLVRIVAQRQGGRLQLVVADNGCGIAPENLTRVFAHGFTTRANGHGFGLHSCVLAAKDMGGTLAVHSDGPGQGARFTLDIPCADGAA